MEILRGATQDRRRTIVLAAGGTGGHLFPAQALAEILGERDFAIHLMTDRRGRDYGERFPAIRIFDIPSATVSPRRPLKVPGQLLKLARGYLKAHRALAAIRPAAVMGFGGYPSIPPLVAARRLGLPIFLHEQNAVMGRANRMVAAHASLIATAFPKVAKVPDAAADKTVFTGNPVREAVHDAAETPYEPPSADDGFRLLVFGGSQGAAVLADTVPAALAGLPAATRRALKVTQQCRPDDVDKVRAAYAQAGIEAEVAHFYSDLARRIAGTHLVIARAGASTIAELGVIGRPAILVPLPHALDDDQLMNARAFTNSGGGWLVEQAGLTADRLAELVMHLCYDEERLANAAAAAKGFGTPDAALRLADAVERTLDALADPAQSAAAGAATGELKKEPT